MRKYVLSVSQEQQIVLRTPDRQAQRKVGEILLLLSSEPVWLKIDHLIDENKSTSWVL